ncbi:MAG: hypothetical protein DWQ31_17645 [Planctomycetota bacterium]|nr:MAG: hypothetical protein DWQ31_17645 [Planctomycetota bacterium]REJ96802.1 MAG: hypothetical protein DWQ35_03285 [Planctomycetota bacterium]
MVGSRRVNCSEVQERLSAYFDGELADEEQTAVAAHLEGCSACGEELAVFGRLSEMSASLADPQAPPALWNDLEAKLDNDEEQKPMPSVAVAPPSRSQRFPPRLFAVAATVLVAVGLGVAGYKIWFSPDEHDHLAINFEHYLEEFDKNPEKAQQILLAKYNGRPTTVQQAAAKLQYEPVIAKGLPSGCSLKDVYLLDMPCCTCAQAVCRCDDGQHIAVFEHDLDQPVWFGDRPSIDCLCDGKPTNIVQIDDRLAATWKQGNRYITIIGARDLEDVTRFVAHLSGPKPNG